MIETEPAAEPHPSKKPRTMNFFSDQTRAKPQDVKTVRDCLLHFIKEELRKAEGGEGGHIKGLHLFLAPSSEDRHLYEGALYMEEDGRFRNEEVQRIADDYAIDLPAGWELESTFVDVIPDDAKPIPQLQAGLFVRTQKRALVKAATAYIRVLNGEAEKDVYELRSTDGPVTIGREKKVQGSDGFFRINTIAFPGDSQHESNKFISRQHAHIRFDNDSGLFLLFADEGGVPPRNKIKVRTLGAPDAVKLNSMQIGHPLKEGDQVMIGESAILEFSYQQSDM
ncbi:MAG: hypothetical protein JWP27_126 [Flaviaesturariibacter sp.]|nr:hypothetical protein [Flaviaesturariibacter sp.]